MLYFIFIKLQAMAENIDIPRQRIIYQFDPGDEIIINPYKRTFVVGTVYEKQDNGFGAYWVVFKTYNAKKKSWVYEVNRDIELSWRMQTFVFLKDTLKPTYQNIIDNYKIRIERY